MIYNGVHKGLPQTRGVPDRHMVTPGIYQCARFAPWEGTQSGKIFVNQCDAGRPG